ncbi:MAG: hypothetical protein HY978_03775 [Candidatus Liptonbacteria bacterium]|nr:hypothetical protein [Candidatus Liptonbacteria bacterium]
MTDPQPPKSGKPRGLEVMLTGGLLFLGAFALAQALPSGNRQAISRGPTNLVGQQSAYVASSLTAQLGQTNPLCRLGRGGGFSDGSGLTNAQAIGEMGLHGIYPNHRPPRTDFSNIKPSTVNEANRLADACKAWARQYNLARGQGQDCAIIASAGTEGDNHSDCQPPGRCHATGHKIDLGLNDTLNGYIEQNCQKGSIRTGDRAQQYTCPPGGSAIYAREGNHWDIFVPG